MHLLISSYFRVLQHLVEGVLVVGIGEGGKAVVRNLSHFGALVAGSVASVVVCMLTFVTASGEENAKCK